MTRVKVDKRTCNQCGEVAQQEHMRIGGSPFHGWVYVAETNGSTMIDIMAKDTGPWDFCCMECAQVFIEFKMRR